MEALAAENQKFRAAYSEAKIATESYTKVVAKFLNKEIEIEKIEVDEIDLDDIKFYKTNKFFDNLIDKIPYGWRIYYRYYDVKRWFISTYQKIRYGVSDQECWSLDYTITKFVLRDSLQTPNAFLKISKEIFLCATIRKCQKPISLQTHL